MAAGEGRNAATVAIAVAAVLLMVASCAQAATDPKDWQFRLVAGGADSGIVQMRPNGAAPWGYVCPDFIGEHEVFAICRSLGLPPKTPHDYTYPYPAAPPASGPFYLAGVDCASSELQAQQCQSTFYSNGSIPNFVCPSAPGQVLAVQCPEAPNTPPGPPVIFTFVFVPTQTFTAQAFETTFKNNIVQAFDNDADLHSITDARIAVTNLVFGVYPGTTSTTTINITFFFTDDPDPNQPKKEEFEYYIESNARTIFGQVLGFNSSTSIIPPAPPVPPPPDTTGWEFRLRGGDWPYVGLLEVRTSPDAEWGVVCDDGFQAAEGIAACLSAGWLTTSVDIITWGAEPGAEFVMDDVKCIQGDGKPITQCQFKRESNCQLFEAVGINCYFNTTAPPLPPNTTYSPRHMSTYIGWTVVVPANAYPGGFNSTFFPVLQKYLGMNTSRFGIVNFTESSGLYYVTFVILQGKPWEPPRMDYDIKLENADRYVLDLTLSVLDLYANDTIRLITPSPAGPEASGWVVQLSDQANARGLVWTRPKVLTAAGTVCSRGLGIDAAAALCNSAGFGTSDFAGIVPMMGGGTGTIYLSDIKCKRNQIFIDNCSYVVSYEYDKRNNCSHAEDAGLICGSRVGPEPTNVNVVLFAATYRMNGVWNQTFLAATINQYIAFDPSRLVVYSVEPGASTVVRFYIAPHQLWRDTPRTAYEYVLQSISVAGVAVVLKMDSLTWTTGPIPTLATPAPQAVYDITGWNFRIRGGGSVGMLEVQPAGVTTFGLVCADSFGVTAAKAACQQLGFTNVAAVFPFVDSQAPSNGLPILMSNISCPSTATSLGQCAFVRSTPTADYSRCTPGNFLSLSCAPPPTPAPTTPAPPNSTPGPAVVYDALGFIAIMKTSAYSASAFRQSWASYYAISATRIQVDRVTTFETYSYVQFAFINDNSTPPPATPSPAGSTVGMPLYGVDKTVLQSVTRTMSAATLFDVFRIYELRFNDTVPNGPASNDPSVWSVRIAATSPQWSSTFGRVELQAGAGAPWGTICQAGLGGSTALALCNAARGSSAPQVTAAIAIPHFREGTGVIYLSSMTCGTSLSSCTYSYSSPTQKRNSCTHNDDIGLLCGTNVGAMGPMPTMFRGTFVKVGYDGQKFSNGLARLFADWSTRIDVLPAEMDSLNLYINFTFKDPAIAGNMVFTRGDYEMIMKSFTPQGLRRLFGMVELQYWEPPMPPQTVSVVPAPTTSTPATTARPTTTAAPPPVTTARPATTTAAPPPPVTTPRPTTTGSPPTTMQPSSTAPRTTAPPLTTNTATPRPGPVTSAAPPTTTGAPPTTSPRTEAPTATGTTTSAPPGTSTPPATTARPTPAPSTASPRPSTSAPPGTATTVTSAPPRTTTRPTTVAPSTVRPTGVPPTTGAPTTATPSPTILPSVNGVVFTFDSPAPFPQLQSYLRTLLCPGTCQGFYMNPARDIYLAGNVPFSYTADVIAVSFNTTSMMYEALGLPRELWSSSVIGSGFNITSITAAQSLQPLSSRGANQLVLTMRYTGCDICAIASQYRAFRRERSTIMFFLNFGTNEEDMTLVQSSGFHNGDGTFNMTYVVAFRVVDQQVEVAGIDWATFRTNGVTTSFITSASLPPGGSFAVAALTNRIDYEFVYTAAAARPRAGYYLSFQQFAAMIVSAYTGSNLAVSDLRLVAAATQSFSNGSTWEQFIISTPSDSVRTRMTSSQETSALQANSQLYILAAAPIGSATPTTDAPSAGPKSAGGNAPGNIPLIAGAAGGAVFALIVTLALIKKFAFASPKAGKSSDIQHEFMEELNSKV